MRLLTIRAIALFRVLATVAVLANAAVPAASQPAPTGYIEIIVKKQVQVELPSDWTIHDAGARKLTEQMTRSLMPNEPLPTTELAATSPGLAPSAIVRVSFDTLQSPVTQAEFRSEVAADRSRALEKLATSWATGSRSMWEGLAKAGIKEVGKAKVDVEEVGGQLAYLVFYGRTSALDPQKTMRVALYHIPMGSERVSVTLSYIDGDRAAQKVIDRVRRSITIR